MAHMGMSQFKYPLVRIPKRGCSFEKQPKQNARMFWLCDVEAEINTLPETELETQKGHYKDYSPFKGGLYGFPC